MPYSAEHLDFELYTLVETSLGLCGLVWNDRGLTRVQLPEADASRTERRLQQRGAWRARAARPPQIERCCATLVNYFSGRRVEFIDVPLDTSSIPPFDAHVYSALRAVPWGLTTSYGALAVAVGAPGAARAVGTAMAKNPWPIVIPCHRVLAAGGALGGFSAYGGAVTKQKLLELEAQGLEGLPLFAQ
jgi:methylated-DNA-[protein]-cysteine S-methyltransferase